jgi:hypothetical protein
MKVYAIRQRRGKTVEYFTGFERSYHFQSLSAASDSHDAECGIMIYTKRGKAEKDFNELNDGDNPLEIVEFELP